MARKIHYSQPLKYFWKHLYGTQKKLTPELTDEQIFYSLKTNLLKGPFGVDETQETRGLIISGLELWREDSKGELLHIFFLDKPLRDFLEETRLPDLEGIKKFLYENGEIRDIFRYYSNTQTEHFIYKFALHVPNEADGYAFSLVSEEDGSLELYFSHGQNGGRMTDKYYTDLNKKDDNVSLVILKMFRLALNTIAYMNCFPDCVADGVPKDLFEKSVGKTDRSISFQLSEKIKGIQDSPTSKIPHFRKGHFRVLQSDYFANKKGQIIFVAEAMVKGKAKTVSMTSNTEQFVNNIKN
ncbi:hypothetical protein [Pedobacter insulae]|uniref:Uncharacterized protein n=1 Tax=Pedobacter insulae TaxID=414048 RepID=A0A1I2Z0D3_9SPHI|nr:hypothetical protein [Pedobacter insulae]SFH31347.1 hypothetical protein SAMN04489864_108223 [Pedobacter insulae]